MKHVLVCLVAFAMLLGTSVVSAAPPPCPKCPSGCLPALFLLELKDPAPTVTKACPAGCVPIEHVKTLRQTPGCIQGGAPPKMRPLKNNAASTRSRGIFMPTALSNPVGETSVTGYGIGLWDFVFPLNKNLQVGVMVVLPIVVVGAAPHIKAQYQLTKGVSLGFGAQLGFGGPYINPGSGFVFWLGGHIETTFSAGKHAFTVGLQVGTAGAGALDRFALAEGAGMLPNLNYRYEFHRNWSFQLEMIMPAMVGKDGFTPGELLIVAWGFRGHGETLFGDIGAIFPFFKGFIEEVWKFTPFGIPYFSIGMKW